MSSHTALKTGERSPVCKLACCCLVNGHGRACPRLQRVLDGRFDGLSHHWIRVKTRTESEKFCIAMQVVFEEPLQLGILPAHWRSDKTVVSTAVFLRSAALGLASQQLRRDQSLIHLALRDQDEFGEILALAGRLIVCSKVALCRSGPPKPHSGGP